MEALEPPHFACARVICNLLMNTRSIEIEKTQISILTCAIMVQDRTIRRSTTKLNCGLRFSYWHPISLGYRYNCSFLLEAVRPSTITTTLWQLIVIIETDFFIGKCKPLVRRFLILSGWVRITYKEAFLFILRFSEFFFFCFSDFFFTILYICTKTGLLAPR